MSKSTSAPPEGVSPVIRFGGVELDRSTRRLTVDGENRHVEPQVFDVLVYLAENHHRVVPKTELFDEIWGSRFVSESALTSRIRSARSAVGDDGRRQEVIRTAHGTGYQFVAELVADGTSASSEPRRRSFAHFVRPANPFRGRRNDREAVSDLMARCRLVTIIGPGGTGKTRLGAEILADQAGEWAFVDLATVRDGSELGQTLLAALGVELGSADDEIEAAGAFLRTEPVDLLVDNCEHVAVDAADMISRLLAITETTTVLATSRVPLNLRDEHLYRLAPLPVLGHDGAITPRVAMTSPAVALFCDRISQVAHDFELDKESARHVVALCRALDGLPLALELAAARAGTFGLEDLLHRLDDRLDLLDDDRHDTMDRHRSLRATLNWSFDLLDDDCRELFVHLSVFPAGLTLDGLEWLVSHLGLSGTVSTMLDRLVKVSLLERIDHRSRTRYGQLETMRTFGVDRLADDGRLGAARDLQVAWAQTLLAQLDEALNTPWQVDWDDRIRQELPNIRHARRHLSAGGRHGEVVDISVALHEWGWCRDVSELWVWCDELAALDASGVELSDGDRCRIHSLVAQAAWRRGQVDQAERSAVAAQRPECDAWATATAYTSLGTAKLFRGDFAAARDAWLSRFELDGFTLDLSNAALASAYLGDIDTARRDSAVAYRRAEEEGSIGHLAWACYVCGEVQATAGDRSATVMLEAAVERSQAIGATFIYGVATVTLCTLMMAEGRTVEVAGRYRDLITHWLRSGTWTQLWTTLRHAASVLVEHDPATCVLAIDAAASDRFAAAMDDEAAARVGEIRDRAEALLDEERLAEIETIRLTLGRGELAATVRHSLDSFQAAATNTFRRL